MKIRYVGEEQSTQWARPSAKVQGVGECPDQGREQGPVWLEGRNEQADHATLKALALCETRSFQGSWIEEGYAPINVVMRCGVMLAAGMGVACTGAREEAGSPVRALMPS